MIFTMAKGSLLFVTDLTMMLVETFCEVEEVYLLQVVGKSRVAQKSDPRVGSAGLPGTLAAASGDQADDSRHTCNCSSFATDLNHWLRVQ